MHTSLIFKYFLFKQSGYYIQYLYQYSDRLQFEVTETSTSTISFRRHNFDHRDHPGTDIHCANNSTYTQNTLFFLSFFNLNYIRWTSSLPSCLWSLRIFPSLPGSRLTIFIAMQVQHYSILSPVLLSFDVGGVRDYPVGVQIDPSGSE